MVDRIQHVIIENKIKRSTKTVLFLNEQCIYGKLSLQEPIIILVLKPFVNDCKRDTKFTQAFIDLLPKGKKQYEIVITGSTGNIGKPPIQELVQKGHSVTVISSKATRQKDNGAIISNYGGDKKEPWVSPLVMPLQLPNHDGRAVRYLASEEVLPYEIVKNFGKSYRKARVEMVGYS